MKLTATIDIDTDASAREAIPAVEHAIRDVLERYRIPYEYAAGTAPITNIAVTVEEAREKDFVRELLALPAAAFDKGHNSEIARRLREHVA